MLVWQGGFASHRSAMTCSEESPTRGSRNYGLPFPVPARAEPPMKSKRVPWQPWVVVIVVVCVIAVVTLAGSYAVWLYIWSQYDG
jgi:hypothetical protein